MSENTTTDTNPTVSTTQGAPTTEQLVADALEKRYRPRDVREWLGAHNGDAELALEKAINMLNDRFQKHIRVEVEGKAAVAQLEAQLKELRATTANLEGQVTEYKRLEGERTAAEKAARVTAALEKQFPGTHKALGLALRAEGYDFDVQGDEIIALKDDKRHKLKTVLTDEFYAEYPFARPVDEDPFSAGYGDSNRSYGEDVAKHFSASEQQQSDHKWE